MQLQRNDSRLWGGLILIALGVLFLLDEFRIYDVGYFFSRWWPSLLIFFGVMQLLGGRARSWAGPLSMIVVGLIFQAMKLRLFGWLDWSNLWPVLLIGVGIALLLDRLRPLGAAPYQSAPPPDGTAPPPQHLQAR